MVKETCADLEGGDSSLKIQKAVRLLKNTGMDTLTLETLKSYPPSIQCWAFTGPPAKKVSKGAKIRNRYNQVPHLTQDTNGKVTNSQ